MGRAGRPGNAAEKLIRRQHMNLKVIGEGCENCNQLYQNTVDAVEELGITAEIEKVQTLLEIVKLGVMTAPSLMLDGKLIVSGQVASKDKIKKLLKKYAK